MTQPPLKLPDSRTLARQKGRDKLEAPSATRNAEPIFAVLKPYMPAGGAALEIASGTGQHIAALAVKYPEIVWHPSDVSAERFASVQAWRGDCGAQNLRDPVVFDATRDWRAAPEDLRLVYLVNLFHLVSKPDVQAVIRGAVECLETGGRFFVYGPFRRNGRFMGQGDLDFHHSLTAQDPDIGYKDIEWIEAEFKSCGLTDVDIHQVPANNFVIVGLKGG